jgi:hypothetical protein
MAMAWGSGARAVEESDARVEWSELRALIAQRIPEQVLRRLAYIPADELTHVRPQLKALRSELRAALRSGDKAAHDLAYSQLAPLYLAGILCSGDPAETLDWLTSPVLRDAAWQEPDGTWREPEMHRILLTLLLDHRDRAWQRDLAGRLARWLPASGDPRRWVLVDGLAAWSGAAPTAGDGYVIGWVRRGSAVWRDHVRGRPDVREWFAEQGWRRPPTHYATLVDWLRAQSRLTELVPQLFEVADIGIELCNAELDNAAFDNTDLADAEPEDARPGYSTPQPTDRPGPENEWPSALAILANEGTLDRDELLDRCLAKLLRGDQPPNLRGFVLLARQLAPDEDEIASRLATFVALAARGATPSARLAQIALKNLDAAGRLGSVTIAEVSKAVLTRPETSLVNAQLSWIEAAVHRDRGAAPALLRAAAAAFAHPAVTVQERALRLVMRHVRHLPLKEVAELHAAARELDTVLRDEALRILGGDAGGILSSAQTPASLLPAYHAPEPPKPLNSAAELVELFALVLADPTTAADTRTVENILDTAVAEYERDAHSLAEVLEPLAHRYPPEDFLSWDQREVGGALRCLLYALLGEDRRTVAVMQDLYATDAPSTPAPDRAVLYRVYELVENLGRVRIPCVLSTPTRGCGAIDPDVLRLRLERYERSHAAPLPCDLEAALLRVPIEEAQDILAGSPLLATPAGKELAALFAWGEGALPVFDRFVIRRAEARVPRIAPRFSPFHELIAAPDRPPSPITVLSRLPDPDNADLFTRKQSTAQTPPPPTPALALWPSLLPHHPEIIAAHAVPLLYQQTKETDSGRNALLPLLATTAGLPGAVTHLALAYGMAAARAQNRTAAVDAMITLAARRLLDARALGALCGELWAGAMVKPDRLLFSLDAATQAGARREVFAVVAGALLALAPQPEILGLADLLVLAADCAKTADLHEDVSELTALAALAKPTRVAVEARRLLRILNPS